MSSCVFQFDVPHQWIAQQQVSPVSVYCDRVGVMSPHPVTVYSVSAAWHFFVIAHWSKYHCYKQAPSRFDLRCLKATLNPNKQILTDIYFFLFRVLLIFHLFVFIGIKTDFRCHLIQYIVEDWQKLAEELLHGYAKEVIAEAEAKQPDNINERCAIVLSRWSRSHGKDATFRKLVNALKKIKRKDIYGKCNQQHM